MRNRCTVGDVIARHESPSLEAARVSLEAVLDDLGTLSPSPRCSTLMRSNE